MRESESTKRKARALGLVAWLFLAAMVVMLFVVANHYITGASLDLVWLSAASGAASVAVACFLLAQLLHIRAAVEKTAERE